MTTTIPPGSIIEMRHNGQWELWQISADGHGYSGVQQHLLKGQRIYQCVWKGDTLESRRVYVKKGKGRTVAA